MTRPHRAPLSGRAALVATAVALVLLSGFAPMRPAAPVSAGTAETMEAKILALVNAARVSKGLVPLRLHAKLIDLAGDRIAVNAATGVLSHTIAGCLKCQIIDRGIQWFAYGEVLAATSRTWGLEAAQSLFDAWKGSPGHWAILMSNKFNYIGVGAAYRSANGMSYGGAVLTESIDQTRPWAKMLTGSAKGDDVTWTWTGDDTALQTHTSGFKNFDLQIRTDSGSWVPMANATTGRILLLKDRARGHFYSIRVRSRDNRGYVSNWSPEIRVWVP